MNRHTTNGVVVVLLLFLAMVIAPETRATDGMLTGFASAYAPGVMDEVIRARFDNDWWPSPPPVDWYTAFGAVAAMDCGRVGEMAVLVDPAGREYRVLIADCAGADGPSDRFERMGVIVELDAEMWTRLTDAHGRPLRVGLR